MTIQQYHCWYLQPALTWLLTKSKEKEEVGANTTDYPVNVRWQYLSTDKIWNLLLTFSTLWPCMNQLLSVQLMHFCALRSLCSYFFPSFTLAPDAPVFVGKQAGKRETQAHTHTDKNRRAGMDAVSIGGRQTKSLDRHRAPRQHWTFHQVFGLCLFYFLFYSQSNKRETENDRWQKEKRRHQGGDIVTWQLFVRMSVGDIILWSVTQ